MACGEELPLPDVSQSRKARSNWRQRAGTPAAIAMFLVGTGLLFWAAIKLSLVVLFGGSLSEVWSILMVSVLPFLAGWDFLPGTKRNAEQTPVKPPTADPGAPSKSN
jgi:hypothetical protein